MKEKIPRCRGFRYCPKIRQQLFMGEYIYFVEQKGYWMHASIVGPAKPSREEAIKAWKRLLKAVSKTAKRKETP